MTALSMSHAIGREVIWTTGSLEIAVKILDVTKRELYYQLRAYMDGLQAQKVRS